MTKDIENNQKYGRNHSITDIKKMSAPEKINL